MKGFKAAMAAILLCLFLTPLTEAGEPVTYRVGGELYEGYYVSPAPGVPLILLIHDWDGLTEYEVMRAEMLAKSGYAVFAADLFGKSVRPTEVKDKRQHTGELYTNRKKMRDLMMGALEKAKALGADTGRSVAMGYCFGGAAVLELARSGADLKGFATFHGGLKTPEGQSYNNTRGKVVVFHGTADKNITMDHFSQLAKELEEAKIPHEMISYGAAPHAFTVVGSDRYRKDADKASWRRYLQFLRECLR